MSLGLIIGGALGNALDRAIFGAVMDFLNMSCCGIRNPYTFNIADIFIFAGVFGVIGHSWWEERKNKGATE
jgi:signal peptidase II